MAQDAHYAQMYVALKRIVAYQSHSQLKKRAWKDWGCDDPNECLEMAYENIQQEAKIGLKGIRKPPANGAKP